MLILVACTSNYHHVPKAFSSNKPCLLGSFPAAQGSQQCLLDSGMCFYFRSWKLNGLVSFTLGLNNRATELQRPAGLTLLYSELDGNRSML